MKPAQVLRRKTMKKELTAKKELAGKEELTVKEEPTAKEKLTGKEDLTGKEQAENMGEEIAEEGCGCCHKTKKRDEREYKDLIHRLNRIEGQIRGIRGMVEKDAYCTDILTQVAAVNAALNSFNKVLLGNHMKSCVVRDIREGKEETVDELLTILQKLMK